MKKNEVYFSILYYFVFFSLGAFMPLLAPFLIEKGLSGVQIGSIAAIGSFVAIFARLIWGILCDRNKRYKESLFLMFGMSIIAGVSCLFFKSYWRIAIAYGIMYFFQSGIIPVIDSAAVSTCRNYGVIRQWGAVGFAIAGFLAGILAEKIGLFVIFILYACSYMVAIIVVRHIEISKEKIHTRNSFEGIAELFKNKKYVLFLICAFFIYGTFTANNTYFSVLYQSVGGNVAGIGTAFLLFAGSEAPFMKWSDSLIKKFGVENLIIGSIIISLIRWYWYSTSPNPEWMLMLFILQGASVGVYLVASVYYIKKHVKPGMITTGLAVNAALGAGLGTMFCNYMGGFIFENYGAANIYKMFMILNIFALIVAVVNRRVKG